ncbi:MAG: HlyC/CorC family transporter [Armatimonadetes bacterium]|nr:HlyC/CorC family transporter [Armatimonadota bacterium]
MDASGSTFGFVLLGLLLVASALFSAAETAFLAANRLRLRQRAEAGEGSARIADRLLEDAGRLVSTLHVADTIANVGASVLAAALFIRLFGPEGAAFWAFLAMVVLLVVVGEIAPKTVAGRHADGMTMALARPVDLLTRLLGPIIRLLSLAGTVMVRPLGGRVNINSPVVTEEEIRALVKMGEEEGVIEQEEREMIHSIFEFGDTVAREVMVPRIDMDVLEDVATAEEAMRLIVATGHSRIPVFHESIDKIVGILYLKDLLGPLAEGRTGVQVADLARPVYYVPESKRLDDLFREMQRRKVHLAIVVDEYGGTSGLVTIEDLLEEIVGPIVDEHDVEERLVEVVNDQVALVEGRTPIGEVNDLLRLELPAGEVDTIGGFVYSLLGHVPRPGERVAYDGLEIIVEQVEGQRIGKVKITRAVPSAP